MLIIIPELPEVENVRLSLDPNVSGKTIVKAEMNYVNGLSEQAIKKIFHKQPLDLIANRLVGSRFSDINRRGKHLIGVIHNELNEHEMYIHVHLGMAGAWIYAENEDDIIAKYKKHIHVKLTLNDGSLLVFSDIRRHGGFSVYTAEEFIVLPSIKNLGPEPFWENTMAVVVSTLRNKKWEKIGKGDLSKKSIKAALMDQSVMAGTGNIYACEALIDSKLNPKELVKDLTDEEIIKVFSASRDLMAFSISVGGTTFRDYVNGNGEQGGFQDYLKIYGMKKCRVCSTDVISEEVAGRTTHWCPTCQQMKIRSEE
ncbi:Formamidopyrimidine-DNA glycosylase [compost metagenome]